MQHTLSIFCDESGDFGDNAKLVPYYLVTFVLHDQNNNINYHINNLNSILCYIGLDDNVAIHSTPLIRNSGDWRSINLSNRQKSLKTLFQFSRLTKIKSKTIKVDRQELSNYKRLPTTLKSSIVDFINENKAYFDLYDKIVIYYDKGQKTLNSVLRETFGALLNNVIFRIVRPENYYLFQVADLICTLELLNIKYPNLNKSELKFFGSAKRLRKNYLKKLDKIRF